MAATFMYNTRVVKAYDPTTTPAQDGAMCSGIGYAEDAITPLASGYIGEDSGSVGAGTFNITYEPADT